MEKLLYILNNMVLPKSKVIVIFVFFEIIMDLFVLTVPTINNWLIMKNQDDQITSYDIIIYEKIKLEEYDFDDIINSYGYIYVSNPCFVNNMRIVKGCFDTKAFDLLQVELISGRMPEKDNEVAIEQWLLSLTQDNDIILISENGIKMRYIVTGVLNNYHLNIESPVICSINTLLPSIVTNCTYDRSYSVLQQKSNDIAGLSSMVNTLLKDLECISLESVVINETKYDQSFQEEFYNINKSIRYCSYPVLLYLFFIILEIIMKQSSWTFHQIYLLGANTKNISFFLFRLLSIIVSVCSSLSVLLTLIFCNKMLYKDVLIEFIIFIFLRHVILYFFLIHQLKVIDWRE